MGIACREMNTSRFGCDENLSAGFRRGPTDPGARVFPTQNHGLDTIPGLKANVLFGTREVACRRGTVDECHGL